MIVDTDAFIDDLNDISNLSDLRIISLYSLQRFISFYIRHDLGDDKDHSGPEDAAEKLAEDLIAYALEAACDWRNLS